MLAAAVRARRAARLLRDAHVEPAKGKGATSRCQLLGADPALGQLRVWPPIATRRLLLKRRHRPLQIGLRRCYVDAGGVEARVAKQHGHLLQADARIYERLGKGVA
jgi:hypothetical protein